MNAQQQWLDVKEAYLRQIERSLAKTDHPRRAEILCDVKEHLDRKYAELPLAERNWEGYQQIITEMGPPEDYAELLTQERTAERSRFGINELLAVIFVATLIAIGAYLVHTAGKNSPVPPLPAAVRFEADERVLGKWHSIDFVKRIEDFDPAQKKWASSLYLKSLEFLDQGVVWWFIEDSKYKHHWTKGKVNPLSERPAFYYLRNIDGQTYLFFEWISGDVTMRGREPAYYVLKQVKDGETVIPSWFENDPQALGYWVSIDFVKTIDGFKPEQPQTSDLYIKSLLFKEDAQFWWTIGESKPIRLDWTKGQIRPFDVWPATYSIRQINQTDYLFYEYRTQHSQSAGYYIFKRSPQPIIAERREAEAFEEDRQVLGQWTTVDFVNTPDVFRPNQQAWRGKLYVKGLHFKQEGTVEWCFGEDRMIINHQWTKGKLLDEELPARYVIGRYDDGDYLFMEWISGDVTIRGQRPTYYVLRKEE